MQALLIGVLFLAAATAAAGDAAELDFIGFSENGLYFAYAESGVQDGSGFPYCSIRAVQMEGALIAWSTDVVLEGCADSPRMATRAAMSEAKGRLFSLGIKPGNSGFHAVSHPLSDLGVSPDTVLFTIGNYPEAWAGTWQVVLETSSLPDPEMEEMWGFSPASAMVALRRPGVDDPVQLLLEPLAQGGERYTAGYRLSDVYVMGDAVVVLLDRYKLGFEGFDVRFVAACGFLGQFEK